MDAQDAALGVAVLGMSGRFPGANDTAEFWANLREGRDSSTIAAAKSTAGESGPADRAANSSAVNAGGRLDSSPGFDARFFGLDSSDAIDASHRLFLECAWEAFENAGYVGGHVAGPVAVFAAPGRSCADREGLADVVSRTLNLNGPSIDLQTAGGSSLAAVHLACQTLLAGECVMALAGSSTVHVEEECRAAGTVRASAAACVVLKRLADALEDGDHVLAIIRASSLNHAGARHADEAVPGVSSQVRAVGEALAMAGVRADEVSCIEADSAGTRRGDAGEILALTRVFRAQTGKKQYCAVGSVKGNIGHAGEAAGIAGLVKVILALQHRQIPASLHTGRLNADANFDDSPFYANTTLKDWDIPPGRRRIAGVTASGEGGTNVHLIVEEAPDIPAETLSCDPQLLVLSADTPTALDAVTAKLAARLRADSSLPLADVAYTLAVGRKALRFRRALVVRSIADAITALENADAFTDAAAPDGRKTIHEALASLDLEASSAEAATILEQAGQRWAKGAPVDLSTLFEGQRRRRLDLPTYPFEPRRFALDSRSDAATGRSRSATPLAAGAAEMERDLAALWREVLDLREANADQDFFDAGGDSLSAVRLFDRIRGRFGVDLPLATLFEARTLAAMSGLLRDRLAGRPPAAPGAWRREATAQPARPAAPRSLVAVQPGSGGPPLFIVHGAAGHVLNVTDLARALGPAQAVFGLQAVGIDGLSAPRATIEEMARAYLGEIRVVQPHGPYLLAGYSGGGTVAFEMARQLDAAREAIGLLALIDTFHPQMPHPRITALSRLERLGRERISYVRDGLARLLVSRREARDVRQIHQHLAAGELVPPALRELHLTRSFVAAADRYAPAPWPGRALLFKAEQVDYYHRAGGPAYGWDATITGGLEVVAIPGDHRSILIGANASRIARRLEQAIEQIPAPVITGAGR